MAVSLKGRPSDFESLLMHSRSLKDWQDGALRLLNDARRKRLEADRESG
jgi:hypothetical protein